MKLLGIFNSVHCETPIILLLCLMRLFFIILPMNLVGQLLKNIISLKYNNLESKNSWEQILKGLSTSAITSHRFTEIGWHK